LQYGDLVSVIVPVFNRAHLLGRTVGSVCSQSYKNIEILIVDDCSTDAIEEAVAALGDARVRLVKRARNGGVAAARNTGVDEAKGALVAFFDSDDICVFDRIERQVRLLLAQPSDYIGVYCARLFYNDVEESNYVRTACHIRPYPHETPLSGDISRRTMQGNIINFPGLLVRRTALLAAGPSDELLRNNVDWDLCLRLTQQGKFAFEPEPLILTPTALKAEVIAQRISRSSRYKTFSYVRITGKLRRRQADPKVLAGHHATAGRVLISQGYPERARRFFRASIKNEPLSFKMWGHFLLSYFPGLHAAIRNRRSKKP
jgi:glycosyltransferase involved in cell wall biosynthesis